MAGAPGLLLACQTLLKDLQDEQAQKADGLFAIDIPRIRGRILVLEAAIKQAIIFPEDS
jgi:hypothetical protein